MITSGRLWPWAVAGVLAVTMAGNIWVMRLAGADTSFAVEPDYYRKAVAWDSTMAQAARNTELDWRLGARLGAPSAGGLATLAVTLHTAAGAPISDAVIRVEATHNADANRILAAELLPAGDGTYHATLPATRRGLWELRLEALRGPERFTVTLRRDTSRDVPTP